jgi:hypothetical protein
MVLDDFLDGFGQHWIGLSPDGAGNLRLLPFNLLMLLILDSFSSTSASASRTSWLPQLSGVSSLSCWPDQMGGPADFLCVLLADHSRWSQNQP